MKEESHPSSNRPSVDQELEARITSLVLGEASDFEREELDQRLAFLGTLGNNAPFIGLFGTVIGVIQAFEELGHSAAGHAGAGAANQVASGAVMSAIAEALVATAVGIAVALPAVAAYNYLQRQVDHVLAGADVLYWVLPVLCSGDLNGDIVNNAGIAG